MTPKPRALRSCLEGISIFPTVLKPAQTTPNLQESNRIIGCLCIIEGGLPSEIGHNSFSNEIFAVLGC